MKKLIVIILLFFSNFLIAQEDIYPVYKGCDASSETTLASCFNKNLTKDVLAEFKVPKKVKADGYKGTVNIIFLVTKTGEFEVLYVRSAYKELETEAKRVFASCDERESSVHRIEIGRVSTRSAPWRYSHRPMPRIQISGYL